MDKYTGDKRSDVYIINKNEFVQVGFNMYYENSVPLKIFKFNFTALLLNISDIAFEEAQKIYDDLELSREYFDNNGAPYYEIAAEKRFEFFKFNEKYFTAIVFAYSAIESYVNSLIKNDEIIRLPKSNETFKDYTIHDIEKQISLKEKIKTILPISRKITIDTKEIPFWEDFCELINIRNEIIHPKSEKITIIANKNDKNIIGIKSTQIKMFNNIYHTGRNTEFIESARKLISYLAEITGYPEVTPLEFRNYEPPNMMEYIENNKIDIEYID